VKDASNVEDELAGGKQKKNNKKNTANQKLL
jgi:hypothetical protein